MLPCTAQSARWLPHVCIIAMIFLTAIGPPTVQEFSPVYYVIAGDPFTLNCTATNDPQSPNELRFRWFKESTRIDNNPSQWNITELSKDPFTVTSQLVITNLTVDKHNGTYSCRVDNFRIDMAVNQTTAVVIESKFGR